jgi:hypothetical protein
MSLFGTLLRFIQQTMQKRRGVMRQHFHTAAPAAFTLVGLVFGLSASTSASEIDPSSAIQGSLGVAIDDLSTGAGATVFLLNVGCALVFAAICIALGRADAHRARRIALRIGSRLAR